MFFLHCRKCYCIINSAVWQVLTQGYLQNIWLLKSLHIKYAPFTQKKTWGGVDEIPGRAQGGWRLRHSRKVKENQTLVPWIEIRGHMDGGEDHFIIAFLSSLSPRVVRRSTVTRQPSIILQVMFLLNIRRPIYPPKRKSKNKQIYSA